MHEKIVKYATKNVFEILKIKTSNVVNTETNVNYRKVNFQYLIKTENWLAFKNIIELKK